MICADIGFAGSTTICGEPSAFVATSENTFPVRNDLNWRVRLSTIAAPSNGVPSWNVMPERALIVQTV